MSVRIYAMARDHEISSKDLLDTCVQFGIDVKSHMSAISEEDATRVLQAIKNRGPRSAAPSASSTSGFAPGTSAPIRREDYIPASGVAVGARVPEIGKPAKPVEEKREPPVATTGVKPKARPLPRMGSAPAPVPRSTTPVKPEPVVAEQPKAQKPLMSLSSVALGGKLRDRPVAPATPPPAAPAPAAKTGPASKPTPTVAKPASPPAPKPIAAEAKPAKGKPAPRIDEEEEERPHAAHRPGAVAGREERQKKRGRRAVERQSTSDAPDLTRVSADDDDGPPVTTRSARRSRRMGVTMPGAATAMPSHLVLQSPVSVRALSEAAGIKASQIISKLMAMNIIMTINAAMDDETAHLVAIELGIELEIKRSRHVEEQITAEPDQPEDLKLRPPVVTFLGHVDHGKTSLLDALRMTNVVASEAGGITQHIGAYQVEHQGKRVTFLDTPGHEAFTAMRARGANVTDVVVLVVAADDGMMPQTEEAISHAKAAGAPIVVAVNKVDLPNANVQRVMQQLSNQNLLPVQWGGDTEYVETSATTRRGLDKLLETIILTAELHELTANPDKPAAGTCLEASLHDTRGVLATVLVREGSLKRGDLALCGQAYGRVKAIFDDHDRPLKIAGPSTPVVVSGLDVVPAAGDHFLVVHGLARARTIAEQRRNLHRAETLAAPRHVTLETLFSRMTEDKIGELRLIIRADVRGSIEAINKELTKLSHPEVTLRILQSSCGAITEGDVLLADASDAVIVGFNVVPDEGARSLAEQHGVEIRRYDIIYKLTEDLRKSLEGMLAPDVREVDLGRALVQQVFKLSRVGTVAGCRVLQGVIERIGKVRLIRDGRVIYPEPGSGKEAGIASLKRVKDDAREVREGFECGIKIAGYDDIKEGDVIEVYKFLETARTL